MSKFIVTGGAGFIGSHLVDFLLSQKHEVIAIDNLTTGNMSNLKQASKYSTFRFLKSDLKAVDYGTLLEKGDTIMHLAATVGVKKVCEETLETFDNNFQGTQILLDAAVKKDCQFLFTSTSEVYGDKKEAMKETDYSQMYVTHGGRCAYTLSKFCGEFLCLAYHEKYNLKVVITRLFNTIGARQRPEYGMVVPKFVESTILKNPITVFDDGKQTRSFCDVSDTVSALSALIQADHTNGEIFNIGNSEPVEILELAEYILSINQSDTAIEFQPLPDGRDQNKDIKDRCPSLDKIFDYINWKPKYHWTEAVKRTNDYYLSVLSPNNSDSIN